MTDGKLSTARPSRKTAEAEPAHVEKARASIASDGEKKIPLLAPARYHRGLQELKNLTLVPVKYLLLEAIDDLFAKYERGDGRFDVDPEDMAELKRRLQALK